MKKLALLSIISLLALSGCNKGGESVDPTPSPEPGPIEPVETDDDFKYDFEYDSKLVDGKKFKMNLHYLTTDFEADNKIFNKNLAINSLASCVASRKVSVANKFFTDLKFTDVYTSNDYDEGHETEKIAYVFATKDLGDKKLVAISVRGLDYTLQEVIDNFNMGEAGDHVGFYNAAEKIEEALVSYLSKDMFQDKTVTYWISGYSRAGAVAGLLTKTIADDTYARNKFRTSLSDIYTYTVEAPNYSIDDNAYPFMQNVVNDYDVVTLVAPTEFGFRRLGNEINVTDPEVTEKVNKEYDTELKSFVYTEEIEHEDGTKEKVNIGPAEYYRRLFYFLLNEIRSDDGTFAILTRADFSALFNLDVSDITSLLTEDNINKVTEYFSSLSDIQKYAIGFQLLTAIGDDSNEDALYTFLISQLAAAHVEVEESVDTFLKSFCSTAQKVLKHLMTSKDEYGSTFLEYALGLKDNFSFIYAMHLPETAYVLLKGYEK